MLPSINILVCSELKLRSALKYAFMTVGKKTKSLMQANANQMPLISNSDALILHHHRNMHTSSHYGNHVKRGNRSCSDLHLCLFDRRSYGNQLWDFLIVVIIGRHFLGFLGFLEIDKHRNRFERGLRS